MFFVFFLFLDFLVELICETSMIPVCFNLKNLFLLCNFLVNYKTIVVALTDNIFFILYIFNQGIQDLN